MKPRIDSVDILRGIVMVLMAIDHARDFFTVQPIDPTDLQRTTAALFLSRWITHFCAPVFVFLAGAGILFALDRGKSKAQMSRFLWTRGLWLLFLEYVVLRGLWMFNFDWNFSYTQVIAVIGASMIILSALVYLPVHVVGWIGAAIMLLHNTLDGIRIQAWWWLILHQLGFIPVGKNGVHLVAYPLIPWFGILCCGYWFGTVFRRADHRTLTRRIGLAMTVGFVALRFTNWYGDPAKWAMQKSALFTMFSFINTQKYPPSLLYMLMTIGPALILLSYLPDTRVRIWSPFLIFGRVPLFYYAMHVLVLHLMVIAYSKVTWGRADWLFTFPGLYSRLPNIPPDFGRSLPGAYLAWFLAILILYPLCRWFAAVKSRNRSILFSYL